MGALEKPDPPPDTRPVATCCGAIQTRIDRHCNGRGCTWLRCVACPETFDTATGTHARLGKLPLDGPG